MDDEKNEKQGTSRFTGFEALPLRVNVRVGLARCRLGQIKDLQAGDVLPLDRRVGEPFDLRAGELLLGRVEPVAKQDGVALKLVEIPEEDNGPDC